jgi:hypothetical protein
MGDTLKSVEPETEAIRWERRLYPRADGEDVLDSVLTPPALVNGKAFLGTTRGDVVCLTADTGEVLWQIHVGEPVVFQPAVANGRVYAATHRDNLYCLDTDDPADDGWLMGAAVRAQRHPVLTKSRPSGDIPCPRRCRKRRSLRPRKPPSCVRRGVTNGCPCSI